jgi:hypothetical protein
MTWEIGQERWFIVDRDVPAPEFTPLYRYLPPDYRYDDRGLPGNWCRVSYEPMEGAPVPIPIIHAPRNYWGPSLESINAILDRDAPDEVVDAAMRGTLRALLDSPDIPH